MLENLNPFEKRKKSTEERKESREGEPSPHTFLFAVADPRVVDPEINKKLHAAIQENNDKIFENNTVIGIEVTPRHLAARCTVNIDPQHTDGDINTAAIEKAVSFPLPDEDVTFVTVRADLDSVGSMAVLAIRNEGGEITEEMMERITLIADVDKFKQGPYPGPRPLPTEKNLYDREDDSLTAAIASEISDFKVPLEKRVEAAKEWLKTGKESEEYRTRAHNDKMNMVRALENGEVKHETRADGKIAAVESTHRFATEIGYCHAPVVVAFNPEFKIGNNEPHPKFTICTYSPEFADIDGAWKELKELELELNPNMTKDDNNWGGNSKIAGSPQGIGSVLSMDQVVEVLQKYLKE